VAAAESRDTHHAEAIQYWEEWNMHGTAATECTAFIFLTHSFRKDNSLAKVAPSSIHADNCENDGHERTMRAISSRNKRLT
jgi:hypothetical protein